MQKVNSFKLNQSLFNVAKTNNLKPQLPKHNLRADTVSFTSLSIFKRKSFWERAIQLFNPKPTPGEIAINVFKYIAQGMSVIGSGIAIFSITK